VHNFAYLYVYIDTTYCILYVSACIMYACECLVVMFDVINICVVFDSVSSEHVTAMECPFLSNSVMM
jgi:hypothetical protein